MRALHTGILVLVAAVALLAAAPRPAAAAAPCWQVLLNDWYDGRIDHTYPVGCYDAALRHLPTDIQEYSSAHDDIERALLDAKAADRRAGRTIGPQTPVPPQPRTHAHPVDLTPTTRGTPPPPTTAAPARATTAPLPGNRPPAGLQRLADRLNPSSPSAVPLPLVVLAVLALLLLAAGGVGWLARHRQNRL